MSASGRSRWWLGSRSRSKRSISRLASGSTEPSWSAMKTLPPERVTRASSETASSGRRTWWSTRWQPRCRTPRSRTAAPSRRPRRSARSRAPFARPPRGSRRACRRRRPRRRCGRARTRARRCRSRRRARPRCPVNGPSSRRTRSARSAAAPLLQREPQLDAHDAPPSPTSARASSSASSRVEIVPAARSSSMASRIRPISGPGSRPSSSPRTSGSGGSARRAASTTPASSGAPTNASASSAHGSVVAPEAVDGARRRLLGPARRGASAARTAAARWRSGAARAPRRRPRRAGSRVVDRVEPPVERAAERARAGRPRRAGGSPAGESRSSSARIRSPAGCVTSAADARRSASVRSSMRKPSSSSRRTARSSRSGSSTKIDSETARTTPASRSARPSCGSCGSPARDRHGDRVEGEVARREVGLDAVAERSEVDGLVDAVDDDPPRAVALRERERRAAEATGEAVRGVARIARTRRRGRAPAAAGAGRERRRRRSRPPRPPRISRRRSSIDGDPPGAARARVEPRRDLVADRAGDRACSSMRIPSPTSVTGVPAGSSSQLDGERVHRDRADDAATLALDEYLACPSCRGETRPHTRPGRCRSRSAGRRRTGARSPCSRPARAA